MVTDSVVRLEGYPGLILQLFVMHDFTLFLGYVYGLDVLLDGSVVIGGGDRTVIAHATVTGAVLWRKEMSGPIWSLRIHGGVVVIPADDSNIAVLDVTTGHKLHALPSAGKAVVGVCVFDGLTSDVTS